MVVLRKVNGFRSDKFLKLINSIIESSFKHSLVTKLTCLPQALEDYLWQSSDLLDRLEDMREDLNHNDFADDVAGAKKGMELHNEAKKKIHKIPVENIDAMGQRLLQRWVSSQPYRKGEPDTAELGANTDANHTLTNNFFNVLWLILFFLMLTKNMFLF